MKKILIISYYYHNDEIIGAIRIRNIIKYLLTNNYKIFLITQGINSIIYMDKLIIHNIKDITPNDKLKMFLKIKKNQTISSHYKIKRYKNKTSIIENIFKIWEEIFYYPDITKNWIKPTFNIAKEIIKNNNIDIILSSAHPLSTHIVSSKLKNEYNIPWIADFRDLWTQNHYYRYSRIRKYFEKKLEINTMKNADIIITTTNSFKKKIEQLHKNKKIISIESGFNKSIINYNNKFKSNKISIVYTGALYQGKRDPEILFKVLRKLSKRKNIDINKFEINFYGPYEQWLEDDVTKYNLSMIVRFHGRVLRKEALNKQRNAQILLLLTWNNPEEKGVIPGKVFDYLAARRPILSLGSSKAEGVKIIERTRAGIHCKDENELERYLLDRYDEFINKSSIEYKGIDEKVMRFSSDRMGKQFETIIEDLLMNRNK